MITFLQWQIYYYSDLDHIIDAGRIQTASARLTSHRDQWLRARFLNGNKISIAVFCHFKNEMFVNNLSSESPIRFLQIK